MKQPVNRKIAEKIREITDDMNSNNETPQIVIQINLRFPPGLANGFQFQ